MLRVELLGGLRLTCDGRELPPPSSRRGQALLAWLALHPGVHARSRVAAALRPDASEDVARHTLRQALASLRAALGEDADAHLVLGRDAVGLAGGAVEVDVAQWRERAARGDGEAVAALLRPLVPDLDADWLDAPRDETREAALGLAGRLAAEAEARGDLDAALRWARERAAGDPLAEAAQREVIRLLAATGDRAAALRAVDALRTRLVEELGVGPSAETRAVIDAVLREDDRPAAASAPPPPSVPLPGPVAALAGAPIVGRDDELAALQRAWADAREGPPRVVLLAGDPGIGKTRLAAELARRAHLDGALVLFGRCDAEGLLPYQPLAEALERPLASGALPANALPPAQVDELRRLFPWLGGPDAAAARSSEDPETARYRLFEAVRAAVEALCARAPVVLVVDDLHWAGTPTVALLSHLLRTLDARSLLVVGTYRDAPADLVEQPFARTAEELMRREDVQLVPVAPLDERAVAALLGPLAEDDDLARRVHRRTGGNALFVVELLRDLGERRVLPGDGEAAIPPVVRTVIEQRVARLGDTALAVLRAAAVAGERFALADVEAVCDLAEDDVLDAVEDALAARLVREAAEAPGRYAFTHALVADALRDQMSDVRRRRLHRRLGVSLAERGAPAPAVVQHVLAAGTESPPELVAEWAQRAAAEQLATLAYEEAARTLREAVEVAGDRLDAASRAQLLLALGDALERAEGDRHGREAFTAAAAAAREAGDAELLARAALGSTGLAVTISSPDDEAIALLDEALAATTDVVLRSRLLGALALEHCYADAARADALSADALALAREAGDPATLAEALSARHAVLWSAEGAHERLAVAEEMHERARAAGDRIAALQARHWRVLDLFELARVADAEDEIAAYEAEAAELRLARYQWYVPLWRAAVAALRGEFAEADRRHEEAVAFARSTHDRNAEPHLAIQRLQLLVEQRRYDEVDLEWPERSAREGPAERGAWLGWLAIVYAGRGEVERARERYDELAADDFAALPRGANWHAVCEAAESCLLLGDRDRAPALIERLRPFADLNPVMGRGFALCGPLVARIAALEELAGRTEEAIASYERALALCEEMGAVPMAERVRERLAALRAPTAPSASRPQHRPA